MTEREAVESDEGVRTPLHQLYDLISVLAGPP